MNLQEQWKTTWNRLGASGNGRAIYHDLLARYSEDHRRYHTIQHLTECFERLRELRDLEFSRAHVEAAIWFHDAIYNPRALDNEQRSAEFCASTLSTAGVETGVIQVVEVLILSTRHTAIPEEIDAAVLADVDLSILAAPPDRFAEYERQIREEYAWVPEQEFLRHRAAILDGFLRRPAIFRTEQMRGRYEKVARENLRSSLARLGAP